jgi:hypothetical protein
MSYHGTSAVDSARYRAYKFVASTCLPGGFGCCYSIKLAENETGHESALAIEMLLLDERVKIEVRLPLARHVPIVIPHFIVVTPLLQQMMFPQAISHGVSIT